MHSNGTKRRSELGHIFLAVIVTAVIVMFLASPFVLAGGGAEAFDFSDSLTKTAVRAGITSEDQQTTLPFIFGSIIKVSLGLVGIIFLLITIVAGYRWMMAGGNEETTTNARRQISNGIIGVLITLGAYAITYYVIDALI